MLDCFIQHVSNLSPKQQGNCMQNQLYILYIHTYTVCKSISREILNANSNTCLAGKASCWAWTSHKVSSTFCSSGGKGASATKGVPSGPIQPGLSFQELMAESDLHFVHTTTFRLTHTESSQTNRASPPPPPPTQIRTGGPGSTIFQHPGAR